MAGIFEVMSSSAIDADELWANLMWIRSIVATLQGAPVTVFRAERQFNVPQASGETMIVKGTCYTPPLRSQRRRPAARADAERAAATRARSANDQRPRGN